MTRQIEFLNPPELMKPVGFSHAAATRGGRTILLSGQVAKDRDGRVVGKGDIVAQFRQVCENLKTLVAAAGGQLTDVVKLTMYVLDTPEFKRQGKPIGVAIPEQVTLAVVEADPVVRGQTAASSYKPAKLENGVRILVPPFVVAGERVVVDTNELTYVRRAE